MSSRATSAFLLSVLPACVLIDYTPQPRDGGASPLDVDAAPPASPEASVEPDAGSQASHVSVAVAPAPVCTAGEWCSYHCGGSLGACSFTCAAGQQCEVRCDGPESCAGIVCEPGSTCAIQCAAPRRPLCDVACTAVAFCSDYDFWCGNCASVPPGAL